MNKEFSLVNVVLYDGVGAYVEKFAVETKEGKLTGASKKKIKDYCAGNGEVIKIDVLHAVTFEEIVSYKEDEETYCTFDRWARMYI